MDEPARALSALQALDPGCDREQWVRTGMAAKAAGLPLDEFIDWSSGAASYAGERDCPQVWRSITDGQPSPITWTGFARKAAGE